MPTREVLNWLDQSHKEFIASIQGVSYARWNWKPAPERWSVGETAEHIVLAEALLYSFVQKALAAPRNSAWEQQTKGKTELLLRVMPSRTQKAQAPEPAAPRGGHTPAQVQGRFEKQRVVIAQLAAEPELPWMEHTAEHPFPLFGTLSAYQWLLSIPLHTIRHGKQIAEVKAAPGYPAEKIFGRPVDFFTPGSSLSRQ
jgi:hypothetical protein